MLKQILVIGGVLVVMGLAVFAVVNTSSRSEEPMDIIEAVSQTGADTAGSPQRNLSLLERLKIENGNHEKEATVAESETESKQEVFESNANNPLASMIDELSEGEQYSQGRAATGGSYRGNEPVEAVDPEKEEEAKKAEEKRLEKMKQRMLKKMRTLSRRLKLDEREQEDFMELTENAFRDIADVRSEFSGSDLSDYDRQVARDQVRDIYERANSDIHSLLGDERYREYKKENHFYGNPDARAHHQGKQLEKIREENKELKKRLDRIKPRRSRRQGRKG